MNYNYVYDSPVGALEMISDGSWLIGLYFGRRKNSVARGEDPTIIPLPGDHRAIGQVFCRFTGEL